MNNLVVIPSICQSRSASTYTVVQSISEGSLLSHPSYKLSSSWEKFVAMSAQRPGAESTTTDILVPTQKSTIAGPMVLKPTPLPEDYDAMVESFLHFLDTL
jgi:hypothetical protein